MLGLTHEETMDLLQNACHNQQVMIVFSRPHEQNGAQLLSPSSVVSPSILGSMSFLGSPLTVSSVSVTAPSSVTDSNNNSANYKSVKSEITKDVNGLGFIIEGGKNSSLGDRPIVIKRIFRGKIIAIFLHS